MSLQEEVWVILTEDENNFVWDKIDNDFHFKPSIDLKIKTFNFPFLVDTYDLKKSNVYWDKEHIDKLIKSIFIECMKEDEYMYALDWQHTCYRYNPRIIKRKDNPTFIKDERYFDGGYNAYFPEFCPDGDYYFFIAKDFSWGYLTHPWQEKLWIYGDCLMTRFRKHAKELGLVLNDD